MPDTRPDPSAVPTPQDIAAVLDWWRLAGVGYAYRDAAERWLQDDKPAQERAANKKDRAATRQTVAVAEEEVGQIGGGRYRQLPGIGGQNEDGAGNGREIGGVGEG